MLLKVTLILVFIDSRHESGGRLQVYAVGCALSNRAKLTAAGPFTLRLDNSDHSSNGVFHVVMCVRVVHVTIGVDACEQM